MPGRFALLIGNSRFLDAGLVGLTAPRNDVADLRRALEDPVTSGFAVQTIYDASSEKARGAIYDHFDNRYPDDLVLLYYSGHGLRDNRGDLYFAVKDTKVCAPGRDSIEGDFIRKQMDNSRSRRQILILDCCHSGAFMRRGAKGASEGLRRDDFDPRGHGRFILAAASAEESAFEEDGRSVFTRFLVEGLTSFVPTNEHGDITINDIYDYTCRQVRDHQAPMLPCLWVDEQTAPLVIARRRIALVEPTENERAAPTSRGSVDLKSPDGESGSFIYRFRNNRLGLFDIVVAVGALFALEFAIFLAMKSSVIDLSGVNFSGIGGFILLAVDVVALFSILRSGLDLGWKLAWIITLLFLPILGFLAWLALGRRMKRA